VHAIIFGGTARPYLRLALISCVGLLLCLSKFVAAIAYLQNFPRDMIPLSGFSTLWQSFLIPRLSLFIGRREAILRANLRTGVIRGLGFRRFDFRHSFPRLARFSGWHRRGSADLLLLYVICFPVATGSA
jgi:hypothetical protein